MPDDVRLAVDQRSQELCRSRIVLEVRVLAAYSPLACPSAVRTAAPSGVLWGPRGGCGRRGRGGRSCGAGGGRGWGGAGGGAGGAGRGGRGAVRAGGWGGGRVWGGAGRGGGAGSATPRIRFRARLAGGRGAARGCRRGVRGGGRSGGLCVVGAGVVAPGGLFCGVVSVGVRRCGRAVARLARLLAGRPGRVCAARVGLELRRVWVRVGGTLWRGHGAVRARLSRGLRGVRARLASLVYSRTTDLARRRDGAVSAGWFVDGAAARWLARQQGSDRTSPVRVRSQASRTQRLALAAAALFMWLVSQRTRTQASRAPRKT